MRAIWRKAVVSSLWWTIGRRNLVRLGRLLSNESRLDVANQIAANRETMVQRISLRHGAADQRIVVFDVGANVGEWTVSLLKVSEEASRRNLQVHCFEPCSGTYALLERNLGPAVLANGRVIAVPAALSNLDGTAVLNVVGDGMGINSLHSDGTGEQVRPVTIQVSTLDSYCQRAGIDHIALVKIDTEGHDMSVLEGARGMLSSGGIDVLQFEYNHRWVFSRHFLRDAFELLVPLGYDVGKVTPKAIEFYSGWHPELETFREGNYLACRHEWRARFPQIRWWNEE